MNTVWDNEIVLPCVVPQTGSKRIVSLSSRAVHMHDCLITPHAVDEYSSPRLSSSTTKASGVWKFGLLSWQGLDSLLQLHHGRRCESTMKLHSFTFSISFIDQVSYQSLACIVTNYLIIPPFIFVSIGCNFVATCTCLEGRIRAG